MPVLDDMPGAFSVSWRHDLRVLPVTDNKLRLLELPVGEAGAKTTWRLIALHVRRRRRRRTLVQSIRHPDVISRLWLKMAWSNGGGGGIARSTAASGGGAEQKCW